MNFDKIIGIDTGIGGGFAISWRSNVGTCKMPVKTIEKKGKNKNELDIIAIQKLFTEQSEGYSPVIFIEKVQGWLSDTDTNAGKRFNIQKMVANYEALKSIIVLSGIPFVEVTPQGWQSYLNVGIKGAKKAERKKQYIKSAQKWYPSIKIAGWNADAVLIMRYGAMKCQLDKDWVLQRLQNKNEEGPSLL